MYTDQHVRSSEAEEVVLTPHCKARMKQVLHARIIAAPNQSHFATSQIIYLPHPCQSALRPIGGEAGRMNTNEAMLMPPNGLQRV
jgi:hypothetical protein